MSLIYRLKQSQPNFTHGIQDYLGEIIPFAQRIRNPVLKVPMVALKSMEWATLRPRKFVQPWG